MPVIDRIPLNQVLVVERLSKAPLGALLQLCVPGNAPAVVVKANIANGNGFTGGIVPLEGDDAGVFYSDDEVDDLAVLDVTTLAEIALTNPGPARLGISAPPAGCVCRRTEKPDVGLSVRPLRSPNNHVGYVLLCGDERGMIISAGSWIMLGEAIVIPRGAVP